VKPYLLKGNSLFSSKAIFLVSILSSVFLKKNQTTFTYRKDARKIFDCLPKISFDFLLEDNVVGMFSQDSLYFCVCF